MILSLRKNNGWTIHDSGHMPLSIGYLQLCFFDPRVSIIVCSPRNLRAGYRHDTGNILQNIIINPKISQPVCALVSY